MIRKFKESDAEDVCDLVAKTFNNFVAKDFTKAGRTQFLKEQSPEEQIKRSKTRDVFVAVDKGKIIGILEGNKDKVTRLFVDKKHHGKGIAKNLMLKFESKCRKTGLKRIRVFSSLYAIKFYEHIGYRKSTSLKKRKGFVYQPMVKILR